MAQMEMERAEAMNTEQRFWKEERQLREEEQHLWEEECQCQEEEQHLRREEEHHDRMEMMQMIFAAVGAGVSTLAATKMSKKDNSC